jgi:hypothetical protein
VHPQIRPKGLHNLLAVEVVPRDQSEQLYKALGFPQAPPILFDEPRANPHAKAAQQPNAHHLRLAPLSLERTVAVLVVVKMGCWLQLGMATHLLSLQICFKRKTGSLPSLNSEGSRLRCWLCPFLI